MYGYELAVASSDGLVAGRMENIREATVAYLESLQAHGEPIPPSIDEEVIEVAV